MNLKGFITELDLNNKEKTECFKHSGTGRFAFNWAIDLINKTRPYEIYWSSIDLHKHWVATFKKENKWVKEVSKWSPQQAFRNLGDALQRFWDYKKEIKGKIVPLEKLYKKKILLKVGKKYILKDEWKNKHIPLNLHYKFPNFKKKSIKDKFYLEGNKKCPIVIEKNRIKLPKIGWVKTYEILPEGISPKNVTISLHAGKWFVSFKYEVEKIKVEKKKGKVGTDLGIKVLAMLSDGTIFHTSKKYKELQTKLARLQRKLSRQYLAYEEREKLNKEKNIKRDKLFLISNNYEKTKLQIQKLHYRIACIRKDKLHKLTSYLAKNHSEVVIEDLNVSGMMKNHNLAGAIANGSFFEFRKQLTYKCEFYDTKLTIADRFFASTKTCSCCGHKKDKMPLKLRIFHCEKCGLKMDRDLNAAINLMNYEENYTVSQTVKACDDTKFQNASSVGVCETGIKHQTPSGKFG
jgi:putative transposase